jgi:hypothetical protein
LQVNACVPYVIPICLVTTRRSRRAAEATRGLESRRIVQQGAVRCGRLCGAAATPVSWQTQALKRTQAAITIFPFNLRSITARVTSRKSTWRAAPRSAPRFKADQRLYGRCLGHWSCGYRCHSPSRCVWWPGGPCQAGARAGTHAAPAAGAGSRAPAWATRLSCAPFLSSPSPREWCSWTTSPFQRWAVPVVCLQQNSKGRPAKKTGLRCRQRGPWLRDAYGSTWQSTRRRAAALPQVVNGREDVLVRFDKEYRERRRLWLGSRGQGRSPPL